MIRQWLVVSPIVYIFPRNLSAFPEKISPKCRLSKKTKLFTDLPTDPIHRLGVSTAHASKQFCIVLILATLEDFTLPRKKTVGKKSGSHKIAFNRKGQNKNFNFYGKMSIFLKGYISWI